MCYSAQIKADYRDFVRQWGAIVSLKRFVGLFWEKRKGGGWAKIPKAVREAFRRPSSEGEFELAKLVAEADREQVLRYEEEVAAQSERLATAERALASLKPTKKARDEQRTATNKIRAAQGYLESMRRNDLVGQDSRIYPGA